MTSPGGTALIIAAGGVALYVPRTNLYAAAICSRPQVDLVTYGEQLPPPLYIKNSEL